MYIERVPNRQSPPAVLLRESYRADGKIKKRTLANLSDWPTHLVEGVYSAQGERSGRRLGYNGLAGQDAADGAEGAQPV
jgi:hypothetical protein